MEDAINKMAVQVFQWIADGGIMALIVWLVATAARIIKQIVNPEPRD